MQPVRHLILLFVVLLGACTMRSAINTMTSEEDRRFAQELVTRMRQGDSAWLQQHFRPDLWQMSGKQIGSVASMFPSETGTTEIIGFNVSSSMNNGRTERTKEFTLVTHGGGRWTVTNFRTYSEGGVDRVVQWRVTPHNSPPPELTIIQSWDRAVPWIWGVLILVLGGIIALIVWLVRRSRRRRQPAAQGIGTP